MLVFYHHFKCFKYYCILKSNLFTVFLEMNMILCKQINFTLKVGTKVQIGYMT